MGSSIFLGNDENLGGRPRQGFLDKIFSSDKKIFFEQSLASCQKIND